MNAKVVGKVDLSDKRGMERWGKMRTKPPPLPPFPALEVMVGRVWGRQEGLVFARWARNRLVPIAP